PQINFTNLRYLKMIWISALSGYLHYSYGLSFTDHFTTANVTRFGSSYARHKLLTKSIKKGFDTILKEILQHTNNRVRAWFILFTFEFSISMDSKLAVIFFVFFGGGG